MSPATAAAITSWADVDTELDHLAGCYCAAAADLPRPLMAAEACTELGHDAGQARLSWLRRAVIAGLERRRLIVIDERDRYEAVGYIGPIYRRNSLVQQLELMEQIRSLQQGQPMRRTLSTAVLAVVGAIAITLGGCGGGGDEEQPQRHPPVDCQAKPEQCK